MKKIYFQLPLLLISNFLVAQIQVSAIDYLDTNNVRAAIICNADFGWDFSNSQYEVPKGSGKHPLYCGSLWIGGYQTGALKMAANTYRQTGLDFWPGPLDTTNASITIPVSNQWNQLWKITSSQINQFIQQWNLGNVQSGTFIPPAVILNWPAHGTGNQAKYLAPFVDKNGNGIYNPVLDGDYPLIKGDQMIWWVINDALTTHGTGYTAMGVEIHCSAYAYNRPCTGIGLESLNNTTFYNYKIFNRSGTKFDSSVVGFFIDADLGSPFDDYVGCNVEKNIAFTYNGGITDAVYGADPPAFSLLTLKGPIADLGDGMDNNRDGCLDCSFPFDTLNCMNNSIGVPISDNVLPENTAMSSFIYMDNTTPTFSVFSSYYNMLDARWGSGMPLTYGGNGTSTTNPQCKFSFPGNTDPKGWGLGYQPGNPYIQPPIPNWTEHNLARPVGDRRMYVGMGKFTLQPNLMYEVEMALVYSRNTSLCNNNLCAIAIAEQDADTLQKLYNCNKFPSCGIVNEIKEITESNFTIYPNPAYSTINIEFKSAPQKTTIEIFDMLGKIVKAGVFMDTQKYISIPVEDLSRGLYTIKIKMGNSFTVKKFVKE